MVWLCLVVVGRTVYSSTALLMNPLKSGIGYFPRYGGGWMHQFGHVYALQQELLNRTSNNWFRAIELWHSAREEGVALNSAHYANILRQCVKPGAWEAAMIVLKQMKRESIRPDVISVGCAMAACVEAKKYDEVEQIFTQYSSVMVLDSVCYLALVRSRMENGNTGGAINAGKTQQKEGIAFAPAAIELLLEACLSTGDTLFTDDLVDHLEAVHVVPSAKCMKILQQIHEQFPNHKIPSFLQSLPPQLS